MDVYNFIADKDKCFATNKTINTTTEFNDLCDEFETMQSKPLLHCVFRGVNEAKYKLYNSAQREWIKWDLKTAGKSYEDHISQMLEFCKDSNATLSKYYKRLGVIHNDWLSLSFLQHYSAPSPLLDFSKDYKTALFFALSKVTGNINGTNADIDNYVSIYYFQFVNEAKRIETLVHYAKSIVKSIPYTPGIENNIWNNELSYKKIMEDRDAILIPSYNGTTLLRNSNGVLITRLITSNLRSTCQEGEFVCSKSEDEPIEMLFKRKGAKLHCVNIHKALTRHIEKAVFDGSIKAARQQYFQNEVDIAMKAKFVFLDI